MFRCPICGEKSNRKGKPFESEDQVIGHIDGSRDDDHRDVSGSEVREEIEESAEDAQDNPRAAIGSEDDDGTHAVGMAREQSEQAIQMTAAESMDEGIEQRLEDGFDTGYPHGKQKAVAGSNGNDDGRKCPECGNPMRQPEAGTKFETASTKGLIREKHVTVVLERGDHYCGRCDLVIDAETNRVIPGSEFDTRT